MPNLNEILVQKWHQVIEEQYTMKEDIELIKKVKKEKFSINRRIVS